MVEMILTHVLLKTWVCHIWIKCEGKRIKKAKIAHNLIGAVGFQKTASQS